MNLDKIPIQQVERNIHHIIKENMPRLLVILYSYYGDELLKLKNSTHCSLLHEAVIRGAKTIVGFLLEKGIEVDDVDIFTETPLCKAVKKNRKVFINILDMLVEKGANINHELRNGDTPLHKDLGKVED